MIFLKRGLLLLVCALTLVVGGAAWQYHRFLNRPLSVEQGTVFVLDPGSSYGHMVSRLRRAGYSDEGWPWRVLGWHSGHASRLKAGEYLLEPGMTPLRWLNRMVSGDVILHGFTIVEGWTFAQMRNRLKENPAVRQTSGHLDDAAVMAALGAEGMHPEGWFLPETYRFPRGTSDQDLLQQAHQAMQVTLDSLWQKRDLGLPLDSPYQALILASIIEKETGRAEERRRIAGVFSRRLAKGMRLQTDPTVIYGIGADFDGDIRRRDLRTDTPYNTYTRHGLPPTPIALPGRASLEAAVMPEAGESLYFVAKGDGSHEFSTTLEDHQRAVDRYQKGLGNGLESGGR